MNIIIRRFLELFVPLAFLSALATFLNVNSLVPTGRASTGFVMFFMISLYVLYHIFLLTGCFDDIELVEYYMYNVAAYAVFLIVNAIFYFFAGDSIYTWFFSLTKVLSVFSERLATKYSVLCFHGIMIAITVAIPPIKIWWEIKEF